MIMRLGLLFFAIISFYSSNLWASELKPIAAVFDLRVQGMQLDPAIKDGLTDLLVSRLAESGRVRVVPRHQVHKRLMEQKISSYRECYQRSCQVELGRELAANWSLAPRVTRVADSCTIALDLFGLRSATLAHSATAEGPCDPGGLKRSLELATRRLLGNADGPAPVPTRPAVAHGDSLQVDASVHESQAAIWIESTPREQGWFMELTPSFAYSRFSDLAENNDLTGFALNMTAGHRFGWVTPQVFGFFMLGEREFSNPDGNWEQALVSGGGLLTGASATWSPAPFELELGLQMGFAAVDPPGAGSYGGFGIRTHLAARLAADQLGAGLELAYVHMVDHWHMLTVGLSFSLGI